MEIFGLNNEQTIVLRKVLSKLKFLADLRESPEIEQTVSSKIPVPLPQHIDNLAGNVKKRLEKVEVPLETIERLLQLSSQQLQGLKTSLNSITTVSNISTNIRRSLLGGLLADFGDSAYLGRFNTRKLYLGAERFGIICPSDSDGQTYGLTRLPSDRYSVVRQTTQGSNGVALLVFNPDVLRRLKEYDQITLVNGMCLFGRTPGEVFRRSPGMKLDYPRMPITEAYVNLLLTMELIKSMDPKATMNMWTSKYEYQREMEETFGKEGVGDAISRSVRSHRALIDVVGNGLAIPADRVRVMDTGNSHVVEHLKRMKGSIKFPRLNVIYGRHNVPALTRELYKYLLTQIIEPLLSTDDSAVIVARPSGELFSGLDAAEALRRTKPNALDNICFIYHPSVPSLNLTRYRDHTAPRDQKIYLGDPIDEIERRVRNSERKSPERSFLGRTLPFMVPFTQIEDLGYDFNLMQKRFIQEISPVQKFVSQVYGD